MGKSHKELSKVDWKPADGQDSFPGVEKIVMASLQRIADATEAMAGPYQKTIADRDMYQRLYRDTMDANERLSRRIKSLRGVITRMKRNK